MAEPPPMQMLIEGAEDAIDGFRALRIGLVDEPLAIKMIDALIDELEYALARSTPDALARTEGGVDG